MFRVKHSESFYQRTRRPDAIVGEEFEQGHPAAYAKYVVEMSFRHPIMYLLLYRWWTRSLLHEEDRQTFDRLLVHYRGETFSPYWTKFSLYHPVQFAIFLFFDRLFQLCVKVLTAFIKPINRIKYCFRQNSPNVSVLDNELAK